MNILLEAPAPGAFHNSGDRFDLFECHPETRTHILTKIMNWFTMWLYGPAGAGKSVIAQTICKTMLRSPPPTRQLPFFFLKRIQKGTTKNAPFQALHIKSLRSYHRQRMQSKLLVEHDSAIFQRSVEAQLTTLIMPLTKLSGSGIFQSTPVPNPIMMIDDLDECRGQQVQ